MIQKKVSDDSEFEVAKAIREKIFKIPLLPQGQVLEVFTKLDAVLYPQVRKLAKESPMIREFFQDIVFRIASGNTLGRNYFDKLDNEDKIEGDKKIFKPSEMRILLASFSLLRLKRETKQFTDIMEKSGFIRGSCEEALELFLEKTANYEELKKDLEIARRTGDLNYIRLENEINAILEEVRIPEDKMIGLINETQEVWDQYVTHRRELIVPYFRKAYTLAKKSSSSDAQTLDNFQNGIIGLVRAVKNYNPKRFAAFSVVAEQWIKQSILFHLKTEANFIKLPVANWHLLQKLDKIKQKIEQNRTREATHEEIAKEAQLPIEKVQKIYENAKLVKVFSLNTPTNNEDDQSSEGSWNMESVQSPHNLEEEMALKKEYQVVEKVVDHFDEEERLIFGLISGCSDLIIEPVFDADDLLREKLRQKAARLGLEVIFK